MSCLPSLNAAYKPLPPFKISNIIYWHIIICPVSDSKKQTKKVSPFREGVFLFISVSTEICHSIRLCGGRSCADSARGTSPSGLPFSAAAGNGYGNYLCCALPCPPEQRRAGWVNTANLFIREYSNIQSCSHCDARWSMHHASGKVAKRFSYQWPSDSFALLSQSHLLKAVDDVNYPVWRAAKPPFQAGYSAPIIES